MRRKAIFVFIILALAALVVLTGCASNDIAYESQLLENADFSAVNEHGLPENWKKEAYIHDDMISTQETSKGELQIISHDLNDIRMVQYFPVHKNTVYRISALIKAEGIRGDDYGAGISIAESFVASRQVFDTAGQWEQVDLYVDSRGETELGVELRLGFFANDAMGKAWFKDVSAVAVESAPENAVVYDYSEIKSSSYSSDDGDGPRDNYTALILCLAALFAMAGLAASRRLGEKALLTPGGEANQPGGSGLALVLLGALFVRLLIASIITGYSYDIGCFTSWASKSGAEGVASLYQGDYFCDYPPGYMYILSVIGGIGRLFNLHQTSDIFVLMVKLPAIICDILAGYLIFRIAERFFNRNCGLLIASLYLFNPAVLVNSAAWGQIDGVLAFGALLSVWLMVNRRMFLASAAFAVTVLIKPQGLMIGPLLAFAFIDTVREEKGKGALKLLGSFVFCAVLCILAAVPVAGGSPISWLLEKYLGTLGSYEYATVNAMNLFAMFGANWEPQSDIFIAVSYRAAGTTFMVLSFIYSAFLYFKAKDRRFLPLAGAIFLCGVFVLGVRMHERYMFPALVLLLFAYVLYRDKRLLAIFVLYSASHFVNVAMVLNHTHLLQEHFAVTFIFSAANLALLAWLAAASWDISAGRIKTYSKPEKNESEENDDGGAAAQKEDLGGGKLQNDMHKKTDHRITRFDLIAMAVVTVLYAALALINLGDTKAPITEYKSSRASEYLVFDFGGPREIQKFTYYGGIGSGHMTLEISDDGESWRAASIISSTGAKREAEIEYEVNTMFMWHDYDLSQEQARYARIVFLGAGIPVIEAAFFDGEGLTPIAQVSAHDQREGSGMDPALIADEQHLVPERSSFMNSMYFDEIYHARTAFEHIHGMQWYETTHPPLGKAFMSFCIMLLGMNPFAWRLAGTVAGIIMLPGMYLLAKLLFKRRDIALVAMLLMALDCMHFAQTRLATIDSFVVMFIIWMYYFMLRYALLHSFNRMPLKKTLLPLLLSGIMFGLGSASKWTGIYAGAGLAVILFYTLYRRYTEAKRMGKEGEWFKNFAYTCLFCVLAFVIIPFGIYFASSFQYFQIKDGKTIADWWAAQEYMFTYHSGLQDSHDFESPWYEWPLMIRPMWLYKGNHDGLIATINTMGNPAVWWPGFAALVWLVVRYIKGFKDSSKNKEITHIGALLLIGFASQFLPWVLVTRCTFIYHYFTCVPFVILIICHFIDVKTGYGGKVDERKLKIALGVYIGIAALMFAFFYPVISGMDIPVWYARLTRWLPTWTIWNY
ncbi:MAG: glycosyltransferase family 39 protein [Christensenellales bacterium]|jgi:dolichyl-phosphate-mannose-protein mannosyltransferase